MREYTHTHTHTCILNDEKAITLIALIVTAVILLILSGIVIVTLTGKNGIITRTKEAKQRQIEAEIKEQLNLAIQELQAEKLADGTIDDITQEWLTQKLSEYNPVLKKDEITNNKKVMLQKNGIIKTYKISENLNITEVENESNIEFSYEIKSRDNGIRKILIKVGENENGINKIECPNGNVIECYGTKQEKSIDYTIEVGIEYRFKIISASGNEIEETILIEPEIIVEDAYIGKSTVETDNTKSVDDYSQKNGELLYINFKATLEGINCTITLKDDISKTLPYVITTNGTYIFIVTGTYSGKRIEKEVEVKIEKYKIYEIRTPQDLQDMSKDRLGSYIIMNDINMEGFNFKTINYENDAYFEGTIDGQGHTISNLSINNTSDKTGIFANSKNSIFKNILLKNVEIHSDTANTGVLAGKIENNIKIEKVGITGNITGNGKIGSFVGTGTAAEAKTVQFINCYAITNINSKNYNVGGFSGSTR